MLKYSLGSLLIVMAVVALGCAAVANWSPLWAEIMTTATVAILLVAVLVALVSPGSARTFAIGFAAVGAAYFLLTFVAPARLRNERLSTSRAIDRLFALTQRAIEKDMTTSEFQFMEVELDTGRVALGKRPRVERWRTARLGGRQTGRTRLRDLILVIRCSLIRSHLATQT